MTLSNINATSGTYNNHPASQNVFGSPNWDFVPHKGMPRLSDDKFESKIDSLAKALAEARDNPKKYEAIREEANKVRAQYISVVSPDRKGAVNDATNFFNGALPLIEGKKSEESTLTLFDYIKSKNAKIKPSDECQFAIELSSGTEINYFAQVPFSFQVKGKDSDQVIMEYYSGHGGRWGSALTPQEHARSNAFSTQLNHAEKQYFAASKTAQTTPPSGKLDLAV